MSIPLLHMRSQRRSWDSSLLKFLALLLSFC